MDTISKGLTDSNNFWCNLSRGQQLKTDTMSSLYQQKTPSEEDYGPVTPNNWV